MKKYDKEKSLADEITLSEIEALIQVISDEKGNLNNIIINLIYKFHFYYKEFKEAQKSLLKVINLNKSIYELERVENIQKEKREKRVIIINKYLNNIFRKLSG